MCIFYLGFSRATGIIERVISDEADLSPEEKHAGDYPPLPCYEVFSGP